MGETFLTRGILSTSFSSDGAIGPDEVSRVSTGNHPCVYGVAFERKPGSRFRILNCVFLLLRFSSVESVIALDETLDQSKPQIRILHHPQWRHHFAESPFRAFPGRAALRNSDEDSCRKPLSEERTLEDRRRATLFVKRHCAKAGSGTRQELQLHLRSPDMTWLRI